MRICFLAFLLFFIISGLPISTFCFSSDYIEVNLNSREIKFVKFDLGGYSLSGDFSFKRYFDRGSLIYEVEGRDISFSSTKNTSFLGLKDKIIPWVALKLIKQGDFVFIEYISLPQAVIKGNINLVKNELALRIEGAWDEKSPFLKGYIKAEVKLWGKINNFLASGYLTVEDGIYKGREFSHLRLDFLGKPPILNITDSELILKDGTVATISGERVLDLRDFSNLIPGAEFRAQKVFLDNWQVFSEDKKRVGLKKNVDKNIGIFLKADGEEDNKQGPETELLYKMKDDKFLRLKMEQEGTTLRIERRKEF